jgi:hypothetical protein
VSTNNKVTWVEKQVVPSNGGAGRGVPTRRAGPGPQRARVRVGVGDASHVTSALGAEDDGVPAARTLRGGVAAGGETPRQDPWAVCCAMSDPSEMWVQHEA